MIDRYLSTGSIRHHNIVIPKCIRVSEDISSNVEAPSKVILLSETTQCEVVLRVQRAADVKVPLDFTTKQSFETVNVGQ